MTTTTQGRKRGQVGGRSKGRGRGRAKEEYELPSTDEETITNSIKTNKRKVTPNQTELLQNTDANKTKKNKKKSTSKCTNVDTNSTNLDNNSDDDVLSTTHTLSTSTLRAPTPEITLQDEFDLPENINSDTLPEDTNDLQNELHDDSPENTDSLQNISHYLSKSTNQQLSTSNTTDIGPFKNELEICLYISQ
ncbi:unnamed protein product [Rhizophagus irregularis]|uniref:Uncharacterized protein n=1 Tax=Rhizophagus irregularis TaxID=588596 RepID=A0A916EEM2_9GLOM|nr:unnamed protein product [Rhizophagus irregularis]